MYGCVFCNEPIPDGQRVCRECMIQRTTIHAKDKKSATALAWCFHRFCPQ